MDDGGSLPLEQDLGSDDKRVHHMDLTMMRTGPIDKRNYDFMGKRSSGFFEPTRQSFMIGLRRRFGKRSKLYSIEQASHFAEDAKDFKTR
jgi:hypothetical protein